MPPRTRLLLHNIQKDRNIESLLNLAAAFHLDEVTVVGWRKADKHKQQQAQSKDDDDDKEANNTDKNNALQQNQNPNVTFVRYFDEVCRALGFLDADDDKKADDPQQPRRSCKKNILVGIEIEPTAVPANKLAESISANYPDCESITFLPGNEGVGLLPSERERCDAFVYVQQFCQVKTAATAGGGGVGSLNVATSVAVVLRQFFCPTRITPSASSSTTKTLSHQQHHGDEVKLVPIAPFTVDVESGEGRRAHFLVRPATALGATKLCVVSPSVRVIFDCGTLRTSFAKNMQRELQCPAECYTSVFQAVRDVRRAETEEEGTSSSTSDAVTVTVVGVEYNHEQDDNKNQKNEQEVLRQIINEAAAAAASSSSSSRRRKTTVALVFCDPNVNDGKLSDSERKHCDVVVNCFKESESVLRPPSSKKSLVNLPQLVSMVLYQLCVLAGFDEGKRLVVGGGAVGGDEDTNDDTSCEEKNQEQQNRDATTQSGKKNDVNNNVINKFVVATSSLSSLTEEDRTKRRERREGMKQSRVDVRDDDDILGGLLC